MTKKDYILLAEALAKAYSRSNTAEESAGVALAAVELSRSLWFDNHNFSEARFMDYYASKAEELCFKDKYQFINQ